jgi:hypothetical protein
MLLYSWRKSLWQPSKGNRVYPRVGLDMVVRRKNLALLGK